MGIELDAVDLKAHGLDGANAALELGLFKG
jgi:hypothetical protein